MATAEGVFPKAGGDPLYNSEVNIFFPKDILGSEFTVTKNFSGTNFILAGSVTMNPSGAYAYSKFLLINAYTAFVVDAVNDPFDIKVLFSGAGITGLSIMQRSVSNRAQDWTVSTSKILTSGNITSLGGHIGSPYTFIYQARDLADTPAQTFSGGIAVLAF